MEEVEPLIKETKAKFLVIDILQKFCRVKDLNDYAQVTRALEPLMATSRKLDCHTQFLHHAGKMEREDGDDILGSTALLGGVDTSIQIRKKPNETRRTFFTMQRYGENIPETVLVIEPQDIEAIAKRVAEIISPLVLHQKQDEKDVIFDVAALSEYLHVNPSWVYKAISLKAIPYFKADKFPRFRKREIDRWTESKAVRPFPSLKARKIRGVST